MTRRSIAGFGSFAELRDFVYATLCEREQFAVGAFPMTKRLIKRGGKACGCLFSVYGPRSVVCNAVLECQTNSIHFYGAGGERGMTTQLQKAAEELLPSSWVPSLATA